MLNTMTGKHENPPLVQCALCGANAQQAINRAITQRCNKEGCHYVAFSCCTADGLPACADGEPHELTKISGGLPAGEQLTLITLN